VIALSDNNEIRQFMVERKYNFQSPQQDAKSSGWKSANPENLPDFTAVGYFFAKKLYEKYHVPIGLIHSSKGGSPAQAWLSEDALKYFPDYYDQLPFLKDTNRVNETIRTDRQKSHNWNEQIKVGDAGLTGKQPWYDKDVDDINWEQMQVPGYWENQQNKPLNGAIWYRKEVDVPLSMCENAAVLYLGNITDDDITYVNGIKVGSVNSPYFPRVYSLAKGILKPGKNEIVVRIINYKSPGGFIKDKPYKLESGKQYINLEGSWKFKTGIAMPPLVGITVFDYKPLGLYNAMIAPLLNYNIKGVIWYQGEGNTNRAMEYKTLFPAMIADWRKNWHIGNFTFLYVQLPGYLPGGIEPAESQWAQLREAQLMTLSVPNTGMAVTTDIGEWNDVHPSNKEDVGIRLALVAEKVAYYDKKVVYSGPIYNSITIKGHKAVITFTNTGSGLVSNGPQLKGFVIAGIDKKFFQAKARIVGNKVEVYSNEVLDPIIVRYGWVDNTKNINLYNKEGLPASPFRTDNVEQRKE
jgi:sialate O-acetylesterase